MKPGCLALEVAVVAGVGVALSLLANVLSPRGLNLSRDYFPGASRSGPNPPPATNASDVAVAPPRLSPTETAAARLRAKGFQVAESNEVIRFFHDPRRAQELIVFVDARDDRHYQEGHVPGAFQFDHYRQEQYLATVLPVCLLAEKVVLYCTGGECEDSEFAAVDLNQAGVPKEKLIVYPGGFTEWTNNRLPVEVGARNSGVLRPASSP